MDWGRWDEWFAFPENLVMLFLAIAGVLFLLLLFCGAWIPGLLKTRVPKTEVFDQTIKLYFRFEKERERERVCVCVCVCASVLLCQLGYPRVRVSERTCTFLRTSSNLICLLCQSSKMFSPLTVFTKAAK